MKPDHPGAITDGDGSRDEPVSIIPAPEDLAAATGLRVRLERESDTPFLRALYRTSRDFEPGLAEWPDDARNRFLDQQFDAQRSGFRHAFPRAACWVLERGEGASPGIEAEAASPIGRLYLERRSGEIRIIDIALVPVARNRGLGSRILRWVTGEARRGGLAVRLHVGNFNPAIRLYGRLGFRPVTDTGTHHLLEWRA